MSQWKRREFLKGAAGSLGMILVFLALCLAAVWWIFHTGYQIKR